MSYGKPADDQFFVLAVFLGIGFMLGLMFELLRFLRRLFAGDGTAAVRVQDVLFCMAAFFVQFFSLLAFADGELRAHLLLSSAAGFLVFRCSVGELLRKLLDRCGEKVRSNVFSLLRPFSAASDWLKKTGFAAKKGCRKMLWRKNPGRPVKKLRKNRKKGLKNEEKSV